MVKCGYHWHLVYVWENSLNFSFNINHVWILQTKYSMVSLWPETWMLWYMVGALWISQPHVGSLCSVGDDWCLDCSVLVHHSIYYNHLVCFFAVVATMTAAFYSTSALQYFDSRHSKQDAKWHFQADGCWSGALWEWLYLWVIYQLVE